MPTWKDIKNYEGFYQVSDTGEVKSLDRVVIYRMYGKETPTQIKGRILKLSSDKDGYQKVILCKNGKTKTFRVHRLVAEAFIENPLGLPTVNHKNLDVADNKVNNLEWAEDIYQCNHKTNNVRVEYLGEVLTVTELWRKYADKNVNRAAFKERLRRGWNIDDALITEVV